MMIAQRTLHLQLDEGRTVPVSIRKETTERSRHTGKELVQLHGWATAEEEGAHRAISGLLRTERGGDPRLREALSVGSSTER